MSRSICFFALFAVLLPFLAFTRAQPTQVYNHHACSGGIDGFESDSVFATNLNQVLSTFSSLDQTNNGFYNLSLGQHEDQISSIALCRGDVGQSSCLECIKFATTALFQRCPNQMGAIIWYDNCMFRYTNWYMFRSLEGTYARLSNDTSSSDTVTYDKQLFTLLEALRDKASAGNSTLKFATGDTKFIGAERIYALVQCIPDLDQMQCDNCLSRAFDDITKSIPGRAGGRILGASCSVRFNATSFY
ncbi:hypothetical protein QQ045_032118 [Rhodiola kirilowii]